jgi:hypothetical protein
MGYHPGKGVTRDFYENRCVTQRCVTRGEKRRTERVIWGVEVEKMCHPRGDVSRTQEQEDVEAPRYGMSAGASVRPREAA